MSEMLEWKSPRKLEEEAAADKHAKREAAFEFLIEQVEAGELTMEQASEIWAEEFEAPNASEDGCGV